MYNDKEQYKKKGSGAIIYTISCPASWWYGNISRSVHVIVTLLSITLTCVCSPTCTISQVNSNEMCETDCSSIHSRNYSGDMAEFHTPLPFECVADCSWNTVVSVLLISFPVYRDKALPRFNFSNFFSFSWQRVQRVPQEMWRDFY